MPRPRPLLLATWVVATIGAVVAAVVAPAEQDRRHYDHIAFEHTIDRIQDGQGLYAAVVGGLRDIGSVVTQARSVREPWIFAAWATIPDSALQPAFFALVVLASSLIAARMTRIPLVGLAVGAWLATAGVFGGVDAWLLVELWTVPLILGCCSAWLSGHDAVAAGLALSAFLIRETTGTLLVGLLVAAWVAGRPVRPWVLALAAGVGLLGLHWYLSLDHLAAEGHEAAIVGTGSVHAVISMTSFLVLPDAVGLFVWIVGLWLLWRSALRGAIGLAATPLLGLVVDRPYWGFLAMPLCIVALGGLRPWEERPQPGSIRKTPAVVSA